MRWEVRTMRSATSFYEPTLGKKTAFRFWPIWALYTVIWMLALPLQGLTRLRLDGQASLSGRGWSYLENWADSFPAYSIAGIVLAMIFGALAAMAVCSHLYSSRSANFMGALPAKRPALFLTHYLTGLGWLIVPTAAVWGCTAIVLGVGGMPIAAANEWLAYTCTAGFLFYSFAVACGMLTGHLLALPVFYGIFNGLAAALYQLCGMLMGKYLYGFAMPSLDGTVVGRLVTWLTPCYKLCSLCSGASTSWGQILTVCGAYCAAAAALTALAFLLYRFRSLERAGDVVAWRGLRPVFQYGVAVCAGLALGVGTCLFLGEGALMPAVIIWGLAGYFAARMLLVKSFRVLRYWKGAVAVLAVFAAAFAVMRFDLTGYERRVPDPAQVAAVEVRGLYSEPGGDSGSDLDITLDDPEQIALVTELHRAVAELGEVSAERSNILRLVYTLRNGLTLSRSYSYMPMTEETTALAQAILDDRDVEWKSYGFDRVETLAARGGTLDHVYLTSYDEDWEEYREYDWSGEDARALWDAVVLDFGEGTICVRTLEDSQNADVWLDGLLLEFYWMSGDGSRVYVSVWVPEEAAHTRAALEGLMEEKEAAT